jgi:hypothetical protein
MGLWAVDRVHGARLTGLRNPHQMWAVHSQMDARDLNAKGYVFPAVENKMGGRDLTSPRSNLDRGSLDERQGFNEPKGYLISNPEHGSHDGPLGFNEPTI